MTQIPVSQVNNAARASGGRHLEVSQLTFLTKTATPPWV